MPHLPGWLLGQCVTVVGCFTGALGLLLFKLSADLEKGRALHRKWRWMIGFAFMCLNAFVIDPTAMSLAPLAMLAPLGGLFIVFSMIMARVCLKEPLHLKQMLSIGVVLCGVSLVTFYGPHPAGEPSLDALVRFADNPAFIGFASVAIFLVISDLLLVHWTALKPCRPAERSLSWTLYAAASAAACGGLTSICLKTAATGAREAIAAQSISPLFTPIVPVAICGMAICAPLQLYLLNSSLGSAPSTYAVPCYQSLLILSNATAAGIFFQEFATLPTPKLCRMGAGFLVSVAGIGALSSSTAAAAAIAPAADTAALLPAEEARDANPDRNAMSESDA